jgi:hypothetical protein
MSSQAPCYISQQALLLRGLPRQSVGQLPQGMRTNRRSIWYLRVAGGIQSRCRWRKLHLQIEISKCGSDGRREITKSSVLIYLPWPHTPTTLFNAAHFGSARPIPTVEANGPRGIVCRAKDKKSIGRSVRGGSECGARALGLH